MSSSTRLPSRLTPDVLAQITGSFREAAAVGNVLARCQELGHLISPATVVSQLPLGCEVAVSAVLVDAQVDTYPSPSRSDLLGLKKEALDRIAGAAGVAWHAHASGIVFQERDRIIFTVAGSVLLLDGRERPIAGTKDMDVRDGSPAALALIERCQEKARRDNVRDWQTAGRESAERQIRELRLHLLSHAETKARLRAIATMGLKRAYTAPELARPFFVARLCFTGRTGDPAMDLRMADKIADRFLGASSALYGGGPIRKAEVIDVRDAAEKAADAAGDDEVPAAAPPPAVPRGTPLASEPAPAPRAPAPRAPAPGTKQEGRSAVEHANERPAASSQLRLPKKGGGGPTLAEASDRDLSWWENKIEEGLERGDNPRYRERNEDLLAAIRNEIEWRAGDVGGDDGTDGDDGRDGEPW